MTAADFRIELGTCGEADAQQLCGRVPVEHQLKRTAGGDFLPRSRALPNDPEKFYDCITQRTHVRHPIFEGRSSNFERLIEPMEVIGQIEFAGAARDRAAVFNGVQEFGVAQFLHEQRARGGQVRA